MSDNLPAGVTDTLARWNRGINDHDLDVIASTFTEDALFQGLRPDYTIGHAGVRDYYEAQPPELWAEHSVLAGTALAADAVLVYVAADFHRSADDIRRTRITAVLRRTDDHWLIGHYHVSRVG